MNGSRAPHLNYNLSIQLGMGLQYRSLSLFWDGGRGEVREAKKTEDKICGVEMYTRKYFNLIF